MSIRKPVQTYKLKMQEHNKIGCLFCYGLSTMVIPCLIATYQYEDDFNFYFTSNIESIIRDRESRTVIDRYFFSSNYILEKNKQTGNFKLTEGLLYKITYNKIELHD